MGRRIGPDICKVEIERHYCTRFLLADGRQRSVIPAPEALVEYCGRLMTGLLEQLCDPYREVLVHLETHRVSYAGRETTRSRASSAA
jgi:hypothetical protein